MECYLDQLDQSVIETLSEFLSETLWNIENPVKMKLTLEYL